jgi:hypothetical protein
VDDAFLAGRRLFREVVQRHGIAGHDLCKTRGIDLLRYRTFLGPTASFRLFLAADTA